MSLSQQLWLCYYAVHLRNEVLLIEVESLKKKENTKDQKCRNKCATRKLAHCSFYTVVV